MDAQLHLEPEALVVEIDRISKYSICPEHSFFHPCSLKLSVSDCGELRFVRAVLFFYSLLCECGAKPIRFYSNQTLLHKAATTEPKVALALVHALRTQVAHSVSDSASDNSLLATTRAWFRQCIRQDFPSSDAQWAECYRQLFRMGVELLESVRIFLKSIESDPEMQQMRTELRCAVEGGLSRSDFEAIVAGVIAEQARTDLSPGKFCDRYIAEWTRALNLKSNGTDLRIEARLKVESTLSQHPPPPPITSQEIMAALNIVPGPLVGPIVRERDRLVQAGIRDRQELLAKLSDYFKTLQALPSVALPA